MGSDQERAAETDLVVPEIPLIVVTPDMVLDPGVRVGAATGMQTERVWIYEVYTGDRVEYHTTPDSSD